MISILRLFSGEGVQPQYGDIKALEAIPQPQPGLWGVSSIEGRVQHSNGQISSLYNLKVTIIIIGADVLLFVLLVGVTVYRCWV